MGLLVLIAYWRGVALPESVAITLIFCAFGVKVALALITAWAASKGAVLSALSVRAGTQVPARTDSANVTGEPSQELQTPAAVVTRILTGEATVAGTPHDSGLPPQMRAPAGVLRPPRVADPPAVAVLPDEEGLG